MAPIELHGTNGITNVDGTAAAPSSHGADTDSGISYAANTVSISTSGSERFRFASAGQLGIGGATYGTSGQVLTSGGASAAPTWAANAGKIIQWSFGTTTTEVSGQNETDSGLTTSLTPTSASSPIIIIVSQAVRSTTGGSENVSFIRTSLQRSIAGASYSTRRTMDHGGQSGANGQAFRSVLTSVTVDTTHNTTGTLAFRTTFQRGTANVSTCYTQYGDLGSWMLMLEMGAVA